MARTVQIVGAMRAVVVIMVLGSVAAADPHVEGALHVGYHSTDGTDGDGTEHTGNGAIVDAEGGWRTEHGLISGFVSYSGMHVSGQWADSLMGPSYFHEWDRFVDVGVRGRLYVVGGTFFGLGLAVEQVSEGAWDTNLEPYLEAHAGYTSPSIGACRCAVEALVSVSRVSKDFAFDGTSYRFTLGVRLR